MSDISKTIIAATFAMMAVFSNSSVAAAETTLNFVPSADLQVLDPVVSSAGITKNHGYMIYDTLFGVDSDGTVRPQMLDSHDISEDGLTYTFTLRDGLKWHDGGPVTAADAVASLNRWAARDGTAKILFSRIADFGAVDDRTFKFVLNEPFGAAIDVLAKGSGRIPFIMPERVAKTDPKEQITEFVGSGPFVFVESEWVPGNMVVYRKNEDYVARSEPASGTAGGKRVNLDRVIWKILPDKQSAVSAIQAGEIDLWASPPLDLLPILEADPNIKLVNHDTTGYYGYLVPNHSHPPFDNAKAREALAWLTDQANIMLAMVGSADRGTACASIFTCGTPMSSDVSNEAITGVDAEKARALFEEAGWDPATPIVLLDPADLPAAHAATLVTAQALRSIGLTADVQVMDWATLTNRRKSTKPSSEGGWDIFVTYGSGLSKSNPLFHSSYSASCEKPWWSYACDEELEDLRAQWALADSLEEKQRVAKDYQRRAFSIHSPWLPLGQWIQPMAARSNVSGVLESGTYQAFWNIDKQ